MSKKKTVIYYFSGTGNNRFISKRLAERLGDTDIFPIKVLEVEPKIPKEYKTVVFCVPSYHSHIPNYVARLLPSVEIGKEQRVYSIVGCGGNRGRAVADVRKALAAKGVTMTGRQYPYGEWKASLWRQLSAMYGLYPVVQRACNRLSTYRRKEEALSS